MTAYYNEIDPYAAQWLRNLIAAGHTAPGDVDERDIRDVRPSDLAGYTQCHFFAGIGVWSYALRRAGWPDDRAVWTGSCPCQPFSEAGAGAGFADERHLWPHFHYLIEQCRPPHVSGEQVASKDGLGWLDLVQSDLEGTGYACWAVDLCAAGVGAPHFRQRLFWLAYAERDGRDRSRLSTLQRKSVSELAWSRDECPWTTLPVPGNAADQREFLLLPDGAPHEMGRLRAYGNAIVAQAAEAVIGSYLDAESEGRAALVCDSRLIDAADVFDAVLG